MFITLLKSKKKHYPTLEELLKDPSLLANIPSDKFHTKVTINIKNPEERREYFISKYGVQQMEANLKAIMSTVTGAPKYNVFKIPKKKGGFREITEPIEETKEIHTAIKDWFERSYAKEHNSAHAYVKERNIKTALEAHKHADAEYFLKVDLKNFFPSNKIDFVVESLQKIFPFYYMDKDLLTEAITYCSKDGGLIQGSPVSPIVTNLVMVPIDYTINHKINEQIKGKTYTRYADDIIISSRTPISANHYVGIIVAVLKDTPLEVNHTKTKYQDTKWKNWSLGLMYNKDHNITVGKRKKRWIKNILHRKQIGLPVDAISEQELKGYLAYMYMVEPGYTKYICFKYGYKL